MDKPAFSSALVVLFLSLAGTLSAQVRIVETGAAHLRIVFEPETLDLRLSGGNSWLVGIPAEGDVNLSLVEVEEVRRLSWAEVEAEVEGIRTDGPAVLGEVGFIRNQRVVELSFPLRRETNGTLIQYGKVVVDVYFSRAVDYGQPPSDPWGERYLQHALLNYQQARTWRRPLLRGAAKTQTDLTDPTLIRVFLRAEGMYRIRGSDLAELGVDLDQVRPEDIRLYYGGGRILSPKERPEPTWADRQEMALIVEDGGDGRLDPDDAVLFYGEAAERWVYNEGRSAYEYIKNPYTLDNVYWLGLGGGQGGQRVRELDGRSRQSGLASTASYRVRVHEEAEEFTVRQSFGIKSGYDWYWEDFQGSARNYSVVVQDALDEPVDIRLGFFGQTDNLHSFVVKWNDQEVDEISFEGNQANALSVRSPQGAQEGLNLLGLVHQTTQLTRFDWYELEYSRALVAQRDELVFDASAQDGWVQYELAGFAENPRVFRIAEDRLDEVGRWDFVADGGRLVFQDSVGAVPPRYLALGPSRWKKPLRLELDNPSQLRSQDRGADYLVISHADFIDSAQRLSQWRAQDDRFGPPLVSQVVDVQDIYDEYSGGVLDPTAIRNFLQEAFLQWDPAPFFVVLLGDGVYDYKNNSGLGGRTFIPAYQDGESTYDEWFVRILDDDRFPDMAIGRLSVETPDEAALVVDKLIDYEQAPEVGAWQSRVLLVADDIANPQKPLEQEAFFLLDAEKLDLFGMLPRTLDLIKHYIGRFPLEGQTKPRARDEFLRLFNEGALLLTYVGHGNPDVLAHEQMFVVSRDLDLVDNGRRLPFMYTAASQVGVFDDPVRISMPEALLRLPNGGVVGMIAATRVGFHNSNMTLAFLFHRLMFNSGRQHVPVGLALLEAKQRAQGTAFDRTNMQRYSLFGDPAMRLAQPRFNIEIAVADTLRALGEVTLQGQVLDGNGEKVDDFSGQVRLQAFDSAINSKIDGLIYEQVGVPLFRGLYPVENGRFEAVFRVPKDITYQGIKGRISAYAWEAGKPAAFGAAEGLVLSGTATGVAEDVQGPEITIAFRGQSVFEEGDFIPPRAVLQARINDDSGINVTGETGHEIELEIDGTIFKVTPFFINNTGDYRQGSIEFSLPTLEPGSHMIRLKAWDSFNNSSRVSVQVQVRKGAESLLADVLFHPNPMLEEGHFTYTLPAGAESVDIQVFSLAGRLVDELSGTTLSGYNQVAWNPAQKLANGIYLYRITATLSGAETADKTAAIQVMK